MNPFNMRPGKGTEVIMPWRRMWPQPYDKNTVDPYTRTRVILMNGAEFENVWFSHQFSRHSADNELRRTLSLIRRSEQQQQKLIAHLKPVEETELEHTIGYEQVAVDLTAMLAKRVCDPGIKAALDFALLEDFDHLYRYSNLLDMKTGIKAEHLVGRYTEIMPGRPTVSEHRHPYDDIRFPVMNPDAPLMDILAANIITAAEQQTMNYYMNTSALADDETTRQLYQEIGMIEEQHVSQYGSLLNPGLSWLENLMWHQYVECYLYWSCHETEVDAHIKDVWAELFEQELTHLHIAEELLRRYEHKEWQQVIAGGGEFPAPLLLTSNIEYVRGVLASTVNLTASGEYYADVTALDKEADFFEYQQRVNEPVSDVMSHRVIEEYIRQNGRDYRFESAENPIPQLRDRRHDNTSVGRTPAEVMQNA